MIAHRLKTSFAISAATIGLLGAVSGSAHASVLAFNSSAAFDAAISGETVNAELYSSGTNGQLVANGGTFDGTTYAFAGPTLLGGIITDQFNNFTGPGGVSLGGNQSTGDQFFYGGDSVTVTFAAPVKAVGVYFNVNANSGQYTLSGAGGVASTDSTSFDTDTFLFDGLVADTAFTSATFASLNTSVGSFNIPELETVSAVPLPAALPLFGTALLGLIGAGIRNRAAKTL